MVKGVILVDYTNQGRRGIEDPPDRAEASKAEAAKLGVQVKDLFFTPGGPHDAAISIEAEGPEPIHKFMASVQSLGNVKMKFYPGFLDRGDAQNGLNVCSITWIYNEN